MARITWDDTGKKIFETGIDRGVVYPIGEAGTYGNGEVRNTAIHIPRSRSVGIPESDQSHELGRHGRFQNRKSRFRNNMRIPIFHRVGRRPEDILRDEILPAV